jgi:hypothetical protein
MLLFPFEYQLLLLLMSLDVSIIILDLVADMIDGDGSRG